MLAKNVVNTLILSAPESLQDNTEIKRPRDYDVSIYVYYYYYYNY